MVNGININSAKGLCNRVMSYKEGKQEDNNPVREKVMVIMLLSINNVKQSQGRIK